MQPVYDNISCNILKSFDPPKITQTDNKFLSYLKFIPYMTFHLQSIFLMEYNHHICPFKVSFTHTFNTQNKLSYSIHPEATVIFHLPDTSHPVNISKRMICRRRFYWHNTYVVHRDRNCSEFHQCNCSGLLSSKYITGCNSTAWTAVICKLLSANGKLDNVMIIEQQWTPETYNLYMNQLL